MLLTEVAAIKCLFLSALLYSCCKITKKIKPDKIYFENISKIALLHAGILLLFIRLFFRSSLKIPIYQESLNNVLFHFYLSFSIFTFCHFINPLVYLSLRVVPLADNVVAAWRGGGFTKVRAGDTLPNSHKTVSGHTPLLA